MMPGRAGALTGLPDLAFAGPLGPIGRGLAPALGLGCGLIFGFGLAQPAL